MKELFKNLKFVWKYNKNQKLKLAAYLFFNILSIIISVVTPIISAKIIISLTNNELKQLIFLALSLFLFEIINNIIYFTTTGIAQYIYRDSFISIQTDIAKNMMKLTNPVLDENGSGVFIQRMTSDTSKLSSIFNELNEELTYIITDIGIFIAVFTVNKIAFIFLAISMMIIFYTEKIRTKIINKKDKIYRKKLEQTSSLIGEMVRGARDIKMLNAEDSFLKEVHNKVVDVNNSQYDMKITQRNFHALRGTSWDLVDFLLIILLVILIKNGLLITSALVIYNYSRRLGNIIYFSGRLMESIKDFNLSSSRVFSIMNDDKLFTKEKFGTKHIKKIKGDFEFKNVSFKYNKKSVLEDVSFKIKANETVAFVGKSGAGKTTIFNLLCKLYDIKKGEILIDGINIKELDKDSIRGNITIISQNPYIFNLSIKDNLRLVKNNLTEKEMIEACKIACLHDFIKSLPEGYDTIVGEGGVTLSGGQKQRLAIARALVQKTEIILFDEATSSLDNETQANIQKAIDNMKNDYTILIIAHRLSTIVNSDRILFLNNGKIAMEGTHKELLKKSKEYKELYESEISK